VARAIRQLATSTTIVPRAGHLGMLEQPKRFAEVISRLVT